MLQGARKRAVAAGIDNVAFVQADAQTHGFEAGAFDVGFSRFGIMFFADPTTAFANLRSALRPAVDSASSAGSNFRTIPGCSFRSWQRRRT